MPTALTHDPDAEDFRALARSSPWRFTTLHWTHRQTSPAARSPSGRPGPPGVQEAWLDRDLIRVTVRDNDELEVSHGVPYASAVLVPPTDGSAHASPPTDTPAAPPPPDPDEGLELRSDGLVAARRRSWHEDHGDPMYGNYQWTAMLDPVELADGVTSGKSGLEVRVGVQISDVREVLLRGRRTWQGVCRPLTDAYDPRCGCCPLLDSVASRLPEYGPEDPNLAHDWERLPTAYLVSLDVRTAIVVDVSPLDGDSSGSSFVNEIHAVDAPLRQPPAD